jgi:hypothetical protein
MALKTLADMRMLLRHLPDRHRNRSTWQHVAQRLDTAVRGHDVSDADAALRLALMLDRAECQPAQGRAVKCQPLSANFCYREKRT